MSSAGVRSLKRMTLNDPSRGYSSGRIVLQLDKHEEAHPSGDFERIVSVLHHSSRAAKGPGYLRIYRPSPTVAFSGRDTINPGFRRAAEAARERGFDPLRRPAGGRAVAYTQQSIIVDHIGVEDDPRRGATERFRANAETLTLALRSLGIDAGIGAVAGEYCPGEFSIHARKAVKLVGAAQRIVKNAWLVSAVVQVGDHDQVSAVTSEVYRELGLDWDPATAGSVQAEVPQTTLTDVRTAILRAFEQQYDLRTSA